MTYGEYREELRKAGASVYQLPSADTWNDGDVLTEEEEALARTTIDALKKVWG
jgi:hypothetical protein